MPPELKINRLLWLDILTLWIIMEYTKATTTPPLKRQLFDRTDRSGLINEFLQSNKVDPIYPGFRNGLTSDLPVQDAINKLRRISVLELSYHYEPNANATELFDTVGSNWRKWPLSIPIRKGGDGNYRLDMTAAEYPPK